MSSSGDPAAQADFGAEYWEERYRSGARTSVGDPSPLLMTETGALLPGRALDAGCGRGANAIWLASRGWHVTAVDVSATALTRAQEAAREAGQDVADRIAWQQVDLTSWHPGEHRYDLVTSLYVHVPGPAEDLFGRLAAWVAPAGTLLVVGHDDRGGHAHPPGAQIRTEQVMARLFEDQWEVVVAESREHVVQRPDGAGDVTLHDTVVRARRTGQAQSA